MMRRKSRKKPCRICRKWFSPDPRVGERQKTCGEAECQRKWHTKKCREWNQKNPAYFQEIYLTKKLKAAAESETEATPLQECSNWKRQIPYTVIQEVMSRQQLVIIEYVALLLFRRFQDKTYTQPAEIIKERNQLPGKDNSRRDVQERGS